MKTNGSLGFNISLVIGDCVGLVAAFVAAWFLRIHYIDKPFLEGISGYEYLAVFMAILPFWIITFGLIGLYNHTIYEKRVAEFYRLFIGCFIGLLLLVFGEYALNQPIFPARIIPVYGFIFGFILILIIRSLIRWARQLLFRFNRGITNILLVGNTDLAGEIKDSLSDTRRSGYRVLGIIGDKRRNLPADYSDIQSAVTSLKDVEIHSIIQTELYASEARNQEILSYAQTHHIGYRFVPGNTSLFMGNLKVDLFRGSIPVIAVHQTPLLGWGQVAKRIFDVIVGGLMLIVALPFMLLIALAMKLAEPRAPIFYRANRSGRYGQAIKMLKFRSMKPAYNNMSPEAAFKKMDRPELIKIYRDNGDQLPGRDPRISQVGHFLRATSLDELPQLIDVVIGHISLVGPRALDTFEINSFERKHTILAVKSGLTGLAQVSGRRDISFEERRKLDIYYVQNWSFWLDIVILLKTAKVVLLRRGAK